MTSPIPNNETARLEALEQYQILDTNPEVAFNDLVNLAAYICETPIALISFIDEQRQWFKASIGWEITQIPRDIAFCAHTILLSDGLNVPDVLADERFANNPLVTEFPGIRFYVGFPLTTAEGYGIGALCVMDRVARSLTPKQEEALQTLARQAIAQLELRHHLAVVAKTTSDRQRTQATLRKAKDELELRVAERTAELISVNERLQAELNERERIEAALRVSQARFSGILEIADDAIISVDAQQRIVLFNQGAEKIFGYTDKEVLGQPLDLLLPKRSALSHRQYVADFGKSAGKARKMGERREVFGCRKNGEEFPAEASISKLELGGEIIFTTILRDISDRKSAQAELERLSHQNELILNSVGEGLCGLDLQGRITFVNPAAAKLLGYKVQELIGQSINIILQPLQSDNQPFFLSESLLDISPTEGSVHQVTKAIFWRRDGSSFPVEYVSTPMLRSQTESNLGGSQLGTKSEVVGAVITFRDITERQVVERMKDEFISVVSHELRTPLTSIHGSLGMLASGLLNTQPEKSQRLLEIAVDSTERLVRLINDILDVERIESGKVTMAKQTCNAEDLIVQATEVMQAMADKAGVTLSVSPILVQLWVDPDRIIQTLTNLLSNAIKFSVPGTTVWLTAQLQENQILFQVKDQGRGIPADKLETIFERFGQVDASDSRNSEGTGLGLAICRSIVQQHGGHIWAESTLGEGSIFYFTLLLG